MADYTQPEYVDRRLRFFNNQFLLDQDMIDEQKYHLDRERRLVKNLYTPGIIAGLDVTIIDADTGKITVAKGTAIDSMGQQIVLAADTPLTLTDPTNPLLVISYHEEAADEATAGSKGSSRWHENPVIAPVADGAADVGTTYIPLARFALRAADGKLTIGGKDDSVRIYAGLKLRGPLSVSSLVASNEIVVDAPLHVTSGTAQAPHTLASDGPLAVTGTSSLGGNVTIGTTAAGATLTVNGATALKSSLSIAQATSDANGGDVYLGDTSASHLRLGHHADYSWIQSYGSKPLAINPLGNNVGIGTTTPSARLTVDPQGAGGIVIGNPNTSSGSFTSISIAISAAQNGFAKLQAIKASGSAWGDLAINSEGGNVGIGITAPQGALHVANNYSIFTKTANTVEALARLDSCANSTLILGGPWGNRIYFYWKDENGTKHAASLVEGDH